MNEENLTPSEREAFEALPRERAPERRLEERVVAQLRVRGLLRRPVIALRAWPLRLAPALAASLVLFVGGVATGRWLEAREAALQPGAISPSNATEAVALVEQTGSAYVTAMAELARFADQSDSAPIDRGRAMARTTLHTAANQVVRLTPEDPMATRILQGFELAAAEGTESGRQARSVVWF